MAKAPGQLLVGLMAKGRRQQLQGKGCRQAADGIDGKRQKAWASIAGQGQQMQTGGNWGQKGTQSANDRKSLEDS